MSVKDPVQPNHPLESHHEGAGWWMREAVLAIGLVVLILGSMWIATGTFPPMVVVESGPMMHDLEDGSIGAIDPGDLVLVINPPSRHLFFFLQNFPKIFQPKKLQNRPGPWPKGPGAKEGGVTFARIFK